MIWIATAKSRWTTSAAARILRSSAGVKGSMASVASAARQSGSPPRSGFVTNSPRSTA
jgi:hypothetical protein